MTGDDDFGMPQFRQRLIDFRHSPRCEELRKRYWGKPAAVMKEVTPLWDTSRSALETGSDLDSKELRKCGLLAAVDLRRLRELLGPPISAEPYSEWNGMQLGPALFVIEHWLLGVALTPPLVRVRSAGKWAKEDGFHRMGVAMPCRHASIPVWITNPESRHMEW